MISAQRLSLVAILLFPAIASTGIAQVAYPPAYWDSQTNGHDGGHASTQPAALSLWLALYNGAYVSAGPCGALGTSNYSTCPINDWRGQPAGNAGVNLVCPVPGGTALSPDGITCPNMFYASANQPSLTDCGNSCNKVSDPISPANGNVYFSEDDLPAQGAAQTVGFKRFYNSADPGVTDLGVGWRHSYARYISPITNPATYRPYFASDPRNSPLYGDASSACVQGFSQIASYLPQYAGSSPVVASNGMCQLQQGSTIVATLQIFNGYQGLLQNPSIIAYDAVRDDGQIVEFLVNGSTIQTPPGSFLTLQQTGSGFTLTDKDDNVETYNSAGELLTITSRAGVVQTVSYNSSNQQSAVTDSFGHTITLSYNAAGQLTTVTDPNSHTVQYGYDTQGRLSTVTNLDTTSRTYVYENASFPNALTGVIDESSNRYLTWGYDTEGRGNSAQAAGGADAMTLVYNNDGSVTTTDAFGAVRNFTFTRVGFRNAVSGISGSQCPTCSESAATTYDANGFVASRTDYNGNLTCYANDPIRGLELYRVEGFAPGSACPSNLATYTPATGTRQRKIATTWHATYHLPKVITELNRTTVFVYDGSGNVQTKTITDTSVTPNVARTWTYTYDSYGRVLTAQLPRTDVNSTTTYVPITCTTGSQCGQVNTVTDAVGNITTFNTYNAYGQATQITDPNGIVTTLAYDQRVRLTDRCRNGSLPTCSGGELTHFDYWPTGLLKKVTLPDGSNLQYTYDNAHRLTQVTDQAGNYVKYTLDAMGNQTAENRYDPTNVLHFTHTRTINTLNEIATEVGAAGTAAVTTTFGYDNNGNQTSIQAPLSRNTTQYYDELNRLSQITDPGSGNTYFGYDANDNLTSVKDPNAFITSYSYNGFGDLQQLTSPDTGTTLNTYDSGGNLATSTDARSALATYTYDAVNRVKTIGYSNAGVTDQTLTFTYDTGSNGKGHLTAASDANHSMSWVYDGLGRVRSKGQTIGTVTKSVAYTYTNGDLTGMTTPSGQSIVYSYNSNHQVTSITLNGSTTVLSNVTYEPLGPVNGWTWGNGTSTTRTYDTDGKIHQISSAGVKTFTYDNAFRITGITDTSTGAANWTYGYDLLDRITSGLSGSTTRGWTYDANGNRLTETGSAASTYTINSTSNRISSITGALARTYGYDAAGNTLTYSTVTVTYNNRGRPKTIKKGSATETLVYNALGQMIKTSGGAAGTVLYWYDEAGHLLGEYSSTGALVQETLWLGDLPVATLRPSGSTVAVYYVHTDQLNTPRAVTRPSDNQYMWRWFSDPFGTNAANSNPAGAGTFPFNLRFPGQIFDGQAGLHQNGFRDYDPAIGRYPTSDPIGLGGGVNTYAYVGNSPMLFIDGEGLSAEDVEAIRHHIDQNFPEIHTHGGWEFGDPGPDNLAQASILSGRITVDNYYMKQCLTHDEFVALYFEVLHESMHSTDSLDQRWWDWFQEPRLSANHRRIVNRTRYEEGMNPSGTAPKGGMWGHNDEAPSPPIWPQVDNLYNKSRTCACKQ